MQQHNGQRKCRCQSSSIAEQHRGSFGAGGFKDTGGVAQQAFGHHRQQQAEDEQRTANHPDCLGRKLINDPAAQQTCQCTQPGQTDGSGQAQGGFDSRRAVLDAEGNLRRISGGEADGKCQRQQEQGGNCHSRQIV